MNLILKAIQFAIKKHKGQLRRNNSEYVSHPIAVSYLLSSFKSSKNLEELICACLLHDTLEDTETNFIELASEFTPLVASLVLELTSDQNQIKKIGKLEYLKTKLLGISSYALVIKLADRLHNISDNPTQKTIEDTRELIDHLVINRKLSKTHQIIIEEIRKLC